jgi:hypothetical protein
MNKLAYTTIENQNCESTQIRNTIIAYNASRVGNAQYLNGVIYRNKKKRTEYS